MSSTSSDHAVAIDPLNAERIEIIRGPASLLFTSNALGGVVNLVRNRIASTHPDRIHGIASVQGESVNTGFTGGLAASIPAGNFALQLDGSARKAGDIHAGAGTLANTDYDAYNASAGVSYFVPWGFAGAAAGTLATSYGVPGGFAGAHDEGVRVEMKREYLEAALELLPESATVRRVELRGNYSRYEHRELEATGVIGTEYGLLSGELVALVHHDSLGPFTRGSAGARYEGRNLAANGVAIPPTDEIAVAGFVFEEASFDRFTFSGAARVDHRSITPEPTGPRTSTIGPRSFTGASASLGILFDASTTMRFGITAIRTHRTPTVDELFSEGPHLASYSYEIGNPALEAETGLGLEVSARYADDRGHLSLAAFRNDIDGFVYPRNTGRRSFRTQLPIYQQTGAHVVLQGLEAAAEWELLDRFVIGGTLGYVHGAFAESALPLPMMPPLSARLSLRYAFPWLTVGSILHATSAQNRTAEFETPTSGFVRFDVYAQAQFVWGSVLHTVTLTIDNASDTEYRSHLSRTKSIMPEPGRNAR
ncbi:MAG: TonB-dependent receptor, partial [bacterium]|nr:TonB-dependent receptor [Candidatus Kapabacteria bacterium]